jgi:hypothetical protein
MPLLSTFLSRLYCSPAVAAAADTVFVITMRCDNRDRWLSLNLLMLIVQSVTCRTTLSIGQVGNALPQPAVFSGKDRWMQELY